MKHPPYTVNPTALATDEVVRYNEHERRVGKQKLVGLRKAAGEATAKLQARMRQAIAASRLALNVGGMEEGDDIDEDAISGIALRTSGSAVFQQTFRKIEESAYVQLLVDCSGSMGSATPTVTRGPDGREQYILETKAGYAAVTAAAVQGALRACRIPHGVAGYTNTHNRHEIEDNPTLPNGYKRWSRQSSNLQMHVFVEAPGLHDDGSALPYITGRNSNLDGESVLWAARYAAQHGGAADRVILLVIADGLPAGADDRKIEADALTSAVERTAAADIEVYGIGVGISEPRKWDKFYPNHKGGNGRAPTGNLIIPNEQGITDTVIRELTGLLTRGYGRSRR